MRKWSVYFKLIISLTLILICFFNVLFNEALANSSNIYPIEKVDHPLRRAIITIGERQIKIGDTLNLIDDFNRSCQLKVLKVLRGKALVSTKQCEFNISKESRVTDIDINSYLLNLDVKEVPEENLHENDNRIEIERSKYVSGGVVGTILGAGIGHGIQGRWSDTGWIYTVGEIGTAMLYINAKAEYESCLYDAENSAYLYASDCSNSSVNLYNLSLLLFRLGEIINVWSPSKVKYKVVNKNLLFITP